MAMKTRFEVALEGAQLDVQAIDALHVIKHQLEGLRLALGELAHGPDETTPAMFDAIDLMVDNVTCNVEALIEAPRTVVAT
jgi:hypothetical protein